MLASISAAAKAEAEWSPLCLFKALLVATSYGLSDVRLAEALDDRAYWTPRKTSPVEALCESICLRMGAGSMRGQAGFFDIDERLKNLSAKGDDLQRLKGLVDFEMFRPACPQAVPRLDRGKGGRPPWITC